MNAALTPRHRLIVARLVVEDGWPISEVAARFQVSWPTVNRWADRYRNGESMQDRSSRPHHSPNKTNHKIMRRCIALRLRLREGPVQLACRLGIAPSTVHQILAGVHLNRLSHVDRATGEPVRRYEHAHPGSMIHVDVKKLGNIPQGGGWRYVGRQQGEKNRSATPGKPRNKYSDPLMGKAYVHSVIDDHSRVAYAEVHDDETALTAAAVLVRAVEWFNQRNITVARVLSDNGGAYRSRIWRDTCADLSIKHKRTRPYRPQTNGKIERFHRTLADGWAYARFYTSEAERRAELEGWLHYYNHHRPHTACGNQPPFSRLINVPDQYKAGVPYSSAGVAEEYGSVGPLVVPGSTSCFRCQGFDMHDIADAPDAVREHNDRRCAPSFGPLIASTAALHANQIVQYLSESETPVITEQQIRINFSTMELEHLDRSSTGRCLTCNQGGVLR